MKILTVNSSDLSQTKYVSVKEFPYWISNKNISKYFIFLVDGDVVFEVLEAPIMLNSHVEKVLWGKELSDRVVSLSNNQS